MEPEVGWTRVVFVTRHAIAENRDRAAGLGFAVASATYSTAAQPSGGNHADAGRLAPKGFPKSNKFDNTDARQANGKGFEEA